MTVSIARLRAMAETGRTATAVAREVGLCPATVRAIAARWDFRFRRFGRVVSAVDAEIAGLQLAATMGRMAAQRVFWSAKNAAAGR